MTSTNRILVVDADPVVAELIDEWLGSHGYQVVAERPDAVVVDLPFPRDRGVELLMQVGEAHPGVPIIALSPAFFPCVEASGALARALGVASVLPKPLSRDALIGALGHALERGP